MGIQFSINSLLKTFSFLTMFKGALILAAAALFLMVLIDYGQADDEPMNNGSVGEGGSCSWAGDKCRSGLRCCKSSKRCYQCCGGPYGCPGNKDCNSNRCVGRD